MFLKIKEYNNIYQFLIDEENSLFVVEGLSRKSREVKRICNNTEQQLLSNHRVFNIKISRNFLWVITIGKSIRIDKNNNLNEYSNLMYSDEVPNKEGIYLFDDISDSEKNTFCIYNDSINKKIWNTDISSTLYFLTEENLFYIEFGKKLEKLIIVCNNFNSNDSWRYNVSILGSFIKDFGEEHTIEAKQLIGVWNKQFIVLLNNGEFISLNIENGKLLWRKKQVDKNNTQQNITYDFGLPYHPFLDKQNGMIYILQSQNFIEFDLTTMKASYLWNSKDNLGVDYLFFKQTRIYKGNIYFIASKFPNLGYANTIGIFNIEKRKIIWQYSFEFEKGMFIQNTQNAIQVNDNNLYILDSNETLHIFKKQENIV